MVYLYIGYVIQVCNMFESKQNNVEIILYIYIVQLSTTVYI